MKRKKTAFQREREARFAISNQLMVWMAHRPLRTRMKIAFDILFKRYNYEKKESK